MELSNFNDYLLHNYKLLLVKNLLSKSSIVWYVRYIKQFYTGELCYHYKDKFPYLTNEDLKAIKTCKEKKILNLITTLKKFIKLMSTETLLHKLDKYEDDFNKLKNFYINNNDNIINNIINNNKHKKLLLKKKTFY